MYYLRACVHCHAALTLICSPSLSSPLLQLPIHPLTSLPLSPSFSPHSSLPSLLPFLANISAIAAKTKSSCPAMTLAVLSQAKTAGLLDQLCSAKRPDMTTLRSLCQTLGWVLAKLDRTYSPSASASSRKMVEAAEEAVLDWMDACVPHTAAMDAALLRGVVHILIRASASPATTTTTTTAAAAAGEKRPCAARTKRHALRVLAHILRRHVTHGYTILAHTLHIMAQSLALADSTLDPASSHTATSAAVSTCAKLIDAVAEMLEASTDQQHHHSDAACVLAALFASSFQPATLVAVRKALDSSAHIVPALVGMALASPSSTGADMIDVAFQALENCLVHVPNATVGHLAADSAVVPTMIMAHPKAGTRVAAAMIKARGQATLDDPSMTLMRQAVCSVLPNEEAVVLIYTLLLDNSMMDMLIKDEQAMTSLCDQVRMGFEETTTIMAGIVHRHGQAAVQSMLERLGWPEPDQVVEMANKARAENAKALRQIGPVMVVMVGGRTSWWVEEWAHTAESKCSMAAASKVEVAVAKTMATEKTKEVEEQGEEDKENRGKPRRGQVAATRARRIPFGLWRWACRM